MPQPGGATTCHRAVAPPTNTAKPLVESRVQSRAASPRQASSRRASSRQAGPRLITAGGRCARSRLARPRRSSAQRPGSPAPELPILSAAPHSTDPQNSGSTDRLATPLRPTGVRDSGRARRYPVSDTALLYHSTAFRVKAWPAEPRWCPTLVWSALAVVPALAACRPSRWLSAELGCQAPGCPLTLAAAPHASGPAAVVGPDGARAGDAVLRHHCSRRWWVVAVSGRAMPCCPTTGRGSGRSGRYSGPLCRVALPLFATW